MKIIKFHDGSLGEFIPVDEKELWSKKRNVYICKESKNYTVEIKSNKQTESLVLYYNKDKIFKLNAKTFYFVHFLGEKPYLIVSFLRRIHDEKAVVVLFSLNNGEITQVDEFNLGSCGFSNILGVIKFRNSFFVAFKYKLNSLGEFLILRRNDEIVTVPQVDVAEAILKFLTSCKGFEDKLNLSEELSKHVKTSKDIRVLLEILGEDRYWALEVFPKFLQNKTLEPEIIRKIEFLILKQENTKQKAKALRKLGEFFLQRNDKEKALKYLEKALSIDPKIGVKRIIEKLRKS